MGGGGNLRYPRDAPIPACGWRESREDGLWAETVYRVWAPLQGQGGNLALSREVIGEAEVIALRQERRRKRPHEHIPCRRSEV